MLDNNLINKTVEYVKEFFKEEYSGHDFYHTLRVYNLAKHISDKENCDKEIVLLSALLHDVDDYKIVGEKEDKFSNAKSFLREQNYPEDKITKVCHTISQVSFRENKDKKPDTIEGMIVQDADRLDANGAMGISRTLLFSGNHNIPLHIPGLEYDENRPTKDYKNSATAINHFYEKLLKLKDMLNTDTAKKMAEHRHEYMEKFLEEFYLEWDGKF